MHVEMIELLQHGEALVRERVVALGTFGLLEYVGMALGIVGQLFVARRAVRGFYVWILSNMFLVLVFANREMWGVAILNTYFTIANVYAIWQWGKPCPTECPGR